MRWRHGVGLALVLASCAVVAKLLDTPSHGVSGDEQERRGRGKVGSPGAPVLLPAGRSVPSDASGMVQQQAPSPGHPPVAEASHDLNEALAAIDWKRHYPALTAMYAAKVGGGAPAATPGAMRALAEFLAELEPAFDAAGTARLEEFMLLAEVRASAVLGSLGLGEGETPPSITDIARAGADGRTLFDVVSRVRLDQALFDQIAARGRPGPSPELEQQITSALLLTSGDADLTRLGALGPAAAPELLNYWLSVSNVPAGECDVVVGRQVCQQWIEHAGEVARSVLGSWLVEWVTSHDSAYPRLDDLPLKLRLALRVAMAELQVQMEADLRGALSPTGVAVLAERRIVRLVVPTIGQLPPR